MNPEWLIAGLGNPGKQYAGTRHNVGWMVAAALIEHFKCPVKTTSIYIYSQINIAGTPSVVAMPTTFMNNSGEAILKLVNKLKIPTQKICIILDEYNFLPGKIHLKDSGSDGGHNGLASVIEYLETHEFLRLRCGIGKNFGTGGMIEYVLSNFNESETEARDKMIDDAVESVIHLVKFGKIKAMSDINSGKLFLPSTEKLETDIISK